MKEHLAEATWENDLKQGYGSIKTGNGTVASDYSFGTRFGNARNGTTPEELIGAAHAGCYSMYLSALLSQKNFIPDCIQTSSKVVLGEQDGEPLIERIELTLEAKVPNLPENEFMRLAQEAKEKCPVSKALAAIPEITLKASLIE